MRRATSLAVLVTALALASLASAAPHDDGGMNMGGEMHHDDPPPAASTDTSDNSPMSYFAYGQHSGTIIAHIVLMVLAWCFVLPAGELSSGHSIVVSLWQQKQQQ